MSNLFVIAICLGVGLLLQRLRAMPENSAQVLNQYVINIALPALVLAELPKLTINSQVLVPLFSSWGAVLVSAICVWLLAQLFRWSREITAVMLLLVPLGNTSFVGFPMVAALLGEAALPYAIIYDQLGSFIAVSTYGMFILAYYSGDTNCRLALIKKILTFPPFIAVIIAMLWLGRELPVWLDDSLSAIAASLVPAVMVAVGLQWRLRLDSEHILPLSLALLLKLALVPLLLWYTLAAMGFVGLSAQVSILESAMPAMITAGALAISHNLSPRLVSSIVGYGLLLSLFTVPLWSQLITS